MPDPLLVSTLPELSTLLRRQREDRGWTQHEVARALGVHWSTIARAERGEKWPSAALIVAWARLVGAPLWAIPKERTNGN